MKEKTFVIVEREWVEDKDDIYVVRADSVDNALVAYAKEYYSYNGSFIQTVEERTINMTFWEQFFIPSIYYTKNGFPATDLNADEREAKFNENIENYLGEDKHFAPILIDFFRDGSKRFEELPEELRNCIAIKEVQKNREFYIVKEIDDC